MSIDSSTAARLNNYYTSSETVDTISEFADRQRSYSTYGEFFAAMGIEEPKIVQSDAHPIQVLDIRPKEHDPQEAIHYRLPMANPLDPNQIYQIATIAGTNPDKRIIAVGNPSIKPYNYGLLTSEQRKTVKDGNFWPAVEAQVKYADQTGVNRALEVGYSYGCDLVAAASAQSYYDVKRAIALEPVIGKRKLRQLALDFGSTAKHLSTYVDASDMLTFNEARCDALNGIQYNRGLANLTNIAIARGLAKGGFIERLAAVLIQKPDMVATIAWGSESELSSDIAMSFMVKKLQDRYRPETCPVKSLRLGGQKHALANDIHLQAAIVLEAQR